MGMDARFLAAALAGAVSLLLATVVDHPALGSEPGPALTPTFTPDDPGTWSGCPDDCSFWDVARESLCRCPPDGWRPLSCSTLVGEGWDEPWARPPSGSGGAPRQGWINAADGNFYRLWFFTFAQSFNDPPLSNAYLGSYTLLTPLSRRLMLATNIPFVVTNNVSAGLPTIRPTKPTVATSQSQTSFGDVSITPRVLLHETQDFSLSTELTVVTPTGDAPLVGGTALVPNLGFWYNIAGGWVIRGGFGVNIPLNAGGGETLISQLAIGQTLTAHDVPFFGDFTCYLATVVSTPVSGDGSSVSLTPGIRTHLGDDWYLLAAAPVPATTHRVADIEMIFWFMKTW